MLTATYLVCEFKLRCYKVPYGVPNCVDFVENALFAIVLESFADSKLVDFSDRSRPANFSYK